MGLAELFIWLLKLLGGEALKGRMGRAGLRGELRTTRKALEDSQNKRDELAGIDRLLEKATRERDLLLSEVVRLRTENVALRDELAKLKAERPS